jgi:hypothetical protein
VSSRLAREAIAAALKAARYPEANDRLDGLKTRARVSAVLPELWVRAARSTDQSLRFAPTVDDPYHYSEAGAAGFLVEARLAWHFDRLLFDRDELAVERLRVERSDGAAKLAAKVLNLLFAWQKARLRQADPKVSDDEQSTAALDEAEAEIELDVLTSGWFATTAVAAKRP